jgi:hypothetical protein
MAVKQRWRTGAVAGALAAATATVLTACSSTAPGSPATTAHTATLTNDGRARAILDVLSGTTVLTIGTAGFRPGGPLLKVVTPADAPGPQLTPSNPDGTGGAELVDLVAPNAPAVTVTLNAAVSWQLDLDGGTTRTDLDLRGGQVSGIAFNAGSSLISVALPRPHGSVPVQMAGGATGFQLSLPAGIPARVTAGGGASEVSLEGQQHTGVAGGSVFTTPGWTPGVTGYDIDAIAGASQITVTARPS